MILFTLTLVWVLEALFSGDALGSNFTGIFSLGDKMTDTKG